MNTKIQNGYVDNDSNLNLETSSFLREIINFIFIPILNNLPKNFKTIIKKTNRAAKEVIDNATNHNALEVLYSKGSLFSTKVFMKNIFQSIWFNLDNSRAVRNRLKFVRRELKSHLHEIASYDKQINIISIAAGSSRAIIEVINEEKYLNDTKISVTFLDKNPDAIVYSKKLSETISHPKIELNWINDTIGNFFENNPQKKYDIVEIVGLLDYFTNEKIIETFKNIYSILEDGGIVITANINHNKEEKFITNIIEWPMMYRSVEELADLVNKSGFNDNKIKAYYEPLKVHGIVVARK